MSFSRLDADGRFSLDSDAVRAAMTRASAAMAAKPPEHPVASSDDRLAAGARSISVETRVNVRLGEGGGFTPITVRNSDKAPMAAIIVDQLPQVADLVRAKTAWPFDITGVQLEFLDARACQMRTMADQLKTVHGMGDAEIAAELSTWEPDPHGPVATAILSERTVL
jgi:hypothetical protein